MLLAPAVPSPIDSVTLALCVNVPVNPVKFRDLQTTLAVVFVTVTAPEAPSKNTSSEAVGTAEPPPPPDVVAHLEPAVESQLAVPPTQKRFAI
jgi:hypothetical protein